MEPPAQLNLVRPFLGAGPGSPSSGPRHLSRPPVTPPPQKQVPAARDLNGFHLSRKKTSSPGC